MAEAAKKFGSCCEELKEALEGGDFEPLITVGHDSVIYMTVGLVDLEEEEPGLVDHPLFFCPFCGTNCRLRKKSGQRRAAPKATRHRKYKPPQVERSVQG